MAIIEIDQEETGKIAQRTFADVTGALITVMSYIGDRLGLFKHLVEGPATSEELAVRAQVNERYVREWLSALVCAGYIEYEPMTQRFALPPAHVPVLAQEGSPFFVGGLHQGMIGMFASLPQLLVAFRNGGGVPMGAYSNDVYEGMSCFFDACAGRLVLEYGIPAMPEVQEMLMRGGKMADVGCGRGRLLIKFAQAFPSSSFAGYDFFKPNIEQAREDAQAAGVADRVKFYCLDVVGGLPEQYDLITSFGVVHDAPRPRQFLRTLYQALRPGGRYLCGEINSFERLEENMGMLGAFGYSASVLFCLSVSLADHGAGLGTLGVSETRLREFCKEAGFRELKRIAIETHFIPFALYEVFP